MHYLSKGKAKFDWELTNTEREYVVKERKNEILRAPYFETKADRIQSRECHLQHTYKISDYSKLIRSRADEKFTVTNRSPGKEEKCGFCFLTYCNIWSVKKCSWFLCQKSNICVVAEGKEHFMVDARYPIRIVSAVIVYVTTYRCKLSINFKDIFKTMLLNTVKWI
jgi:hypothetical protein